ncbi:PWWP domain [Cinara cedri]|uniref:PWWP domain n=1 Tax=Cinara cedri TaxID=506608 RepID=A0A5E4MZK2_9HEMI|nr:PWWP domain [Cinara cedri]
MCSKRIFNVKDKVFATTSGYPPWPAIITDIVINSSLKLRYNVYFYGTGGYSLCKSKQLVPYQKNKLKFSNPEGKLDVLQHFAKALLEIENDTDSLDHTIDDGSTCNINNIQKQETSSNEFDKISDIFKEIKSKGEEKKRIKSQPNLRKKKNKVKPSSPKIPEKICSDQSDEDVLTTSNNINSSNQKLSSDKFKNINQVEKINSSYLEGKRKIEIKEDSSLSKKQKHESRNNEYVIFNQILTNLSDEDIQEFTTLNNISNTNYQLYLDKSNFNQVGGINQSNLEGKEKIINKDILNLFKVKKKIPIKRKGHNISKVISHINYNKDAQVFTALINLNDSKQIQSQDKLVSINEITRINQSNLEDKEKVKEESSFIEKQNLISAKHILDIISNEVYSNRSDNNNLIQELTTSSNINNTNQQSSLDDIAEIGVLKKKIKSFLKKKKNKDESNLLKINKEPIKIRSSNNFNFKSEEGAQSLKISGNINYLKQRPSQNKLVTINEISKINQSNLEGNNNNKFKEESSLLKTHYLPSKKNETGCFIIKEICSDQSNEEIQELITIINDNNKNQQSFSDELKNNKQVNVIYQSNLEEQEKITYIDESNLLKNTISPNILNVESEEDAQVFTTSNKLNHSKQSPFQDKLETFNGIAEITQFTLEGEEKVKQQSSLSIKQNIASKTNKQHVISKKIFSDQIVGNIHEFTTSSNINYKNQQTFSDKLKNDNAVGKINQSNLEIEEKIINKDTSNLLNMTNKIQLKKKSHNISEVIPNMKSDKDAEVSTILCCKNYSKLIPSKDKLKSINEIPKIYQSNLESIGKTMFKEKTSSIEKQNLTLTNNILDVICKETCSNKTNENMLEFVPLSNIDKKNYQSYLNKLKNTNQFEDINQSNSEGKKKIIYKNESNLINLKKNVPLKKRSHDTSKVNSNIKNDKYAQVFTQNCHINCSKSILSPGKLESINEITEINQSNSECIEKVEVNEKTSLVEKQNLTLSKNILAVISKETCSDKTDENMLEFIPLCNTNNKNYQSFLDKLKSTNQFEAINQSYLESKDKITNDDESNLINIKNNVPLKKRSLNTSKIIPNTNSDKDAQVFTIPCHTNYSKSIPFQDKLESTNEIAEINQSNLECIEKVEGNEKTNSVEKQNLTLSKNIFFSKETCSDKNNENVHEFIPLSKINNSNHQLNSDNLNNINQFEEKDKSNLEIDEKIINYDELNLLKNNNTVLRKRIGFNGFNASKLISYDQSVKDAELLTTSSNNNYSKLIDFHEKLEYTNEILDTNQLKLKCLENTKVKEQSYLLEKQYQASSTNKLNAISIEICSDQSNMDNMQKFTLGSIHNTNHQSFPDKLEYSNQFECINQFNSEGREKIINKDESNLINKNKNVPLKKRSHDISKVISNIKYDKYAQVFTLNCHTNCSKSILSPGKLESINEIAEINQSNLEFIENTEVNEKTNSVEKQNLTLSKNKFAVISKETCSDKNNENIHEIISLSNINNTYQQLNSDKLKNINKIEGINQSNLEVDEKVKSNDEFNLLKNNNRVPRKRTGLYGLNVSKAIPNVKSDKVAKVVTSSRSSNYSKEIDSQDKLASTNEVLDINQFKFESIENIKIKGKSNLLEKQNQTSSKNMLNFISKETCSDRSNENIKEFTLSNTNHQFNSDKLENINIIEGINKSNLKVDKEIKTNNKLNLLKKNDIVLRKKKVPYELNHSKVISNVNSDKNVQIFTSSNIYYSEQRSSPVKLDKIQKKSELSPISKNIKRNYFCHVSSEKFNPKYLDEKLKYSVSVQLDRLSDYFIAKALGKQPKYAAYYIVNDEGQLIKTSGSSVESSDMIINSCNDSKPMAEIKNIYQINSNTNENANYVSCSGHKSKLNICTSKKQIVGNDKIDHSQEHSSKTEGIRNIDTKGMIYKKGHETNADYRKLLKAQIELEINILSCLKILITNLQIKYFNYGAAITALDRLHKFKFTTLTLLKYKIILDTISKVSLYCISNVNEPISIEQERIIRYKAQTLFNVLMSLFTVSPGQTFEKVYNKELKNFSKKTKHMDSHQIIEYTQYSDLL